MRRRRWLAVGVLVALLGAMRWAADPVPDAARAPGHPVAVRTSTPRFPVARLFAREAEAADGDLPTEIVVVRIAWEPHGLLIVPKEAELDPAVVRPLGAASGEDAAAVVDIVVPETPAEALNVLEAERARALADHHEAWLAALYDLAPNEVVAPDVLVGPPDLEGVLDRADALEAIGRTFDDPDAIDLADLYRVEALWRSGGSEGLELARDLAVALVATAEDDAVAAQAAALLTRLPRGPLPRGAIDRLAGLADIPPDGVDPRDLATIGLDHALRAGDEGAAQAWSDRLEREVELACDRAALGADPRCATDAANVDDGVAVLGLRDPADAVDWRQALVLAAHLCAAERADAVQPVAGEARYTDHWAWPAWEPARSAYTACVEREAARGPPPEAPLAVRITIVEA